MKTQTRKSFFKTLGILTAGSIVPPFWSDVKGNSIETAPTLAKTTLSKKRVLRVAHLTDIHIKPEK